MKYFNIDLIHQMYRCTPYCQNISTPLSTIFQQYRMCKSLLCVKETGVPGENYGHTESHLHNLPHKVAQITLHSFTQIHITTPCTRNYSNLLNVIFEISKL